MVCVPGDDVVLLGIRVKLHGVPLGGSQLLARFIKDGILAVKIL